MLDESSNEGGEEITGTNASDWELVTPRGAFREDTWQALLLSVAGSFAEEELLALAGASAGRVPYIFEASNVDPQRARHYTLVGSRVAVYSHVSAHRAVAMCRWLTRQIGDVGEVVLRRLEQVESGSDVFVSGHREFEAPTVSIQPAESEAQAASDSEAHAFGARLRNWRLARNWRQSQAAAAVGCTSAAWGHWERGLYLPSPGLRRRVVELIGLPAEPVRALPRASARAEVVTTKRLPQSNHHSRLLAHLASFGEVSPGDIDDLGIDEAALGAWLDALLTRRPGVYVATPLFFQLVEGDAVPAAFTTRLAASFLGEHLRRHSNDAIPELEEHVWSRFGLWHLSQPNAGDLKTHAYLSVPFHEARDVAASERLDLFAQLPSKVIGALIREPDFLSEQQSWSADAAEKTAEGPLSRQLRRSWRRPLLLSSTELLFDDDGRALVGQMERAEVTARSHVVGGQPLLEADEWEPTLVLERSVAADRLLRHPLATAIVQFEVHRLFAGLSGEPAALLTTEGTEVSLELDGISRGPVWQHLRVLLEQVGYWSVGATALDSSWASAVDATIGNLGQLGVLERHGAVLRLNEEYQSLIKAHPGHPQNRGEKPYRVRLAQFLSAIRGGME